MQYNTLSSLITALEYGTKLHISVLFLNCYGNRKTRRPKNQSIHTCPVCDFVKEKDFASCFRCRNTVLKLLLKRRKPCSGYCAKGIYEYATTKTVGGSVELKGEEDDEETGTSRTGGES